VTLLPVGEEGQEPRASLVAGFSWVIAANTEKRELAEDFIEFAASSEANGALLTAEPPTGIDPSRLSTLEDATYGEKFPEIQEVNRATLNDALAWPTGENSTQAAQVLTDELAALIAGTGGTAEETMQRVQDQWETLLADD
jgi:multiple sugar transport system substrate-binding protein